MALLVAALAVTANKPSKLRAEKAHSDPPHYYNQTGEKESKTKEEAYEEMEVETASNGGQKGHYQELEVGTLEKGQYESLNKSSTAKF